MPLNSSQVGSTGAPRVTEIDARWVMSYAAGLNDYLPDYLDTLRPGGVVGHPLFPVCIEWPVLVAMRDTHLTHKEALQGVHATHDIVIHRLVRPGEELSTQATVAGLERRKPGAYQTVRLDTTDAAGQIVCSTWYGTLFRGVPVEGLDIIPDDVPSKLAGASPDKEVESSTVMAISPGAAHVYTECARIWNPIHTDTAVAKASGLPGLILHGTATLAHGISQVISRVSGAGPGQVRRVSARFGAMVLMPSEVTINIFSGEVKKDETIVRFEVLTEDGKQAVRDGAVVFETKA